jgi:hypothetical protein
MKRYGVTYNDESGTLTRMDGTPLDHTWSVVDRSCIVDGYPREVSNHDTRQQARNEAKRLNAEHEHGKG